MTTCRYFFGSLVVGCMLSHAGLAFSEELDRQVVIDTLAAADEQRRTAQPASLTIPVQFDFASARLTVDSARVLDQVAAAMNDPTLIARTFVIEGHTDSVGDAEANLRLSLQRAEAVVTYLISRNVASGRLTAAGYGKTRPLPGIPTTDGRNRRVVIVREF